MSVILFVLTIMPGVIAAGRYETCSGITPSAYDRMYHTAGFSCAIMLMNLLIMHLRGWEAYSFDALSVAFIEKYLIADLFLALTLPWLASLVIQAGKSPEISIGGGV